ncbi:hypothetical protein [Maribacter aestuarii]|uniref:hypothetical protein n=1 Tax=Maribacter aestuarii TaxID=1130723 RepID=UPI0025A57C18|nr:hypothetical protein [Maribacter aestuarii]
MAEKTYRKCPNCGKMSLNQDYCPACGSIINTTLKRELARKEKAAKKQLEAATPKKKAQSRFFWKTPRTIKTLLSSTPHVSFIPFGSLSSLSALFWLCCSVILLLNL